jgi:hypothetical protein
MLQTTQQEETWRDFSYDIFWCTTGGKPAEGQAQKLAEHIKRDLKPTARVRVRRLPESINAGPGYRISGYVIRQNADEDQAAAYGEQSGREALGVNFLRSLSMQPTPGYLSLFICPPA